MVAYTQYFGLLELGPNDNWNFNSNQFSTSDRVVIDALLAQGAEFHHHDGASAATFNPTTAPGLGQSATGGSLGAGTTIYYEYTYANPVGLETAPSPVATIVTPSAIVTPAAPTLSPTPGTGTLPPGVYQYAVSAYLTASTTETLASASTTVSLSATGEINVSFVDPASATGVNVYRMGPTDTQFLFMASVAAPTTSFVDDGTVTPNCDRSPSATNTTNTSNTVTGTIISPPAGWTANVYRTTTAGQWGGSQIASGLTSSAFTDTGIAPVALTPPVSSKIPSDPSKVLLTNGAEVQGVLPGSMVDLTSAVGVPFCVTYTFPGTLSDLSGVFTWICPFVEAQIVNVICGLGVGSTPNAQPVKVDVLLGTGVNPTYASIFSGTYPEVPTGQQVGSAQIPTTTSMIQGDTFQVSILQTGGGTQTDNNLSVNIYLIVNGSSSLSGVAGGYSSGYGTMHLALSGRCSGKSNVYSTAL